MFALAAIATTDVAADADNYLIIVSNSAGQIYGARQRKRRESEAD